MLAQAFDPPGSRSDWAIFQSYVVEDFRLRTFSSLTICYILIHFRVVDGFSLRQYDPVCNMQPRMSQDRDSRISTLPG